MDNVLLLECSIRAQAFAKGEHEEWLMRELTKHAKVARAVLAILGSCTTSNAALPHSIPALRIDARSSQAVAGRLGLSCSRV